MFTKEKAEKALAERLGCSKEKAGKTIRAVLDVIEDGLSSENEVFFQGFGRWRITTRPSRMCRNPRTQETIELPEKRVVKFFPGERLKPKQD